VLVRERQSRKKKEFGIHGGIKAREIHSWRRFALRVGLFLGKTPEQNSLHTSAYGTAETDASMTIDFTLARALPATPERGSNNDSTRPCKAPPALAGQRCTY
jgi:hypothetical protein